MKLTERSIIAFCILLLGGAVWTGWRLAESPGSSPSFLGKSGSKSQPAKPEASPIPVQALTPTTTASANSSAEGDAAINDLPSNEAIGKFLNGETESSVK